MRLDHYIETLKQEMLSTAEIGGEAMADTAEKLLASLESSTRLALLEALSAAAAEITSELAPTTVEVKLQGRDPEFIVDVAPPVPIVDEGYPQESHPYASASAKASADPEADAEEADDLVRTTLRLPESLKRRIDEAASREGVSVNSWLTHAALSSLERPPASDQAYKKGSQRYVGWA